MPFTGDSDGRSKPSSASLRPSRFLPLVAVAPPRRHAAAPGLALSLAIQKPWQRPLVLRTLRRRPGRRSAPCQRGAAIPGLPLWRCGVPIVARRRRVTRCPERRARSRVLGRVKRGGRSGRRGAADWTGGRQAAAGGTRGRRGAGGTSGGQTAAVGTRSTEVVIGIQISPLWWLLN